MPIPAPPGDPGPAATVLELVRQLHDQLRLELAELDDGALNWVPAPGANSIATLVTHVVGSEAEALRAVAGVHSGRDRQAEFAGDRLTPTAVVALLDEADRLVAELAPRLDSGLDAVVALPTLPAHDTRSGLSWLVANFGHAQLHLGHIQLTKDLYRQGAAPAG